MIDDDSLLDDYAALRSEESFRKLMLRYTRLVYSAAFRYVGDHHLAEDVVQTVFALLARKAGNIERGREFTGWLLTTTRHVAANTLKKEYRRRKHEKKAGEKDPPFAPEADRWNDIRPVLIQGLKELPERDRMAIRLRFVEKKDLRETGAALGLSPYAAGMCLTRATRKLLQFFARRGIAMSTASIAALFPALVAPSAPAAAATAAPLLLSPLLKGFIAASVAGLLVAGVVLQTSAPSVEEPVASLPSPPPAPAPTEPRISPVPVRGESPRALDLPELPAAVGRVVEQEGSREPVAGQTDSARRVGGGFPSVVKLPEEFTDLTRGPRALSSKVESVPALSALPLQNLPPVPPLNLPRVPLDLPDLPLQDLPPLVLPKVDVPLPPVIAARGSVDRDIQAAIAAANQALVTSKSLVDAALSTAQATIQSSLNAIDTILNQYLKR